MFLEHSYHFVRLCFATKHHKSARIDPRLVMIVQQTNVQLARGNR